MIKNSQWWLRFKLLGIVGFLFCSFAQPKVWGYQSSRSSMEGELDESYAYCQSYDAEKTDTELILKAQIKIKKTGNYTVVGGYVKGDCWHKGTFSGARYYKSTQLTGEAGDVITVTLRCSRPPLNNKITIGVFNSISDICTRG